MLLDWSVGGLCVDIESLRLECFQVKVMVVRQMCSDVVVETVVLAMSVSARHSRTAKYKVF